MKNLHKDISRAVQRDIPFSLSSWNVFGQAIGFGMDFNINDHPFLNDFERRMIYGITAPYWIIMDAVVPRVRPGSGLTP